MSNIDKVRLGIRITKIRVKRRETLEEFAEQIKKATNFKIKTTKSNVSKWEKGLNIPNDITISAIAQLGNTSVDNLLYGENNLRELEKKGKSVTEILYSKADPVKIGKIVKFIRKNYPGSVRAFRHLVNDTMKNFGFEPNVVDKDIEQWESGEVLPNLNQLIALCQLDNLEISKVLSGDIRNIYHEEPMKNMLSKMIGEINEHALKDLIDALNEVSIINFSIPEIFQMYNLNTLEPHKIYDKNSLILYLEERRDGLKDAEKDETLSEDARMDIMIKTATITEDLTRLSNYEEIFQ